MNLTELVTEINNLADESESTQQVTSFINDAIARINISLGADFPFLSIDNQNAEPAFPETWQRVTLIPFGVGRVKQKDSSQFEYTDAYNEFVSALEDMKAKYNVPDQYKSEEMNNGATMDLNNNMFSWSGW